MEGGSHVTHSISNASRQPPIESSHFRLPNFEISWAGEDLVTQGFCFGSEDGKLLFTAADRTKGYSLGLVVESGEPINGIAFLDNLLAVSTPSEVVVSNRPRPGVRQGERSVYGGGAHGIISTPSGKFVAPLGTKGLLLMDPQPGKYQLIKTLGAKDKFFYFYKAVSSGESEGMDVLACALRHDGWANVVRGSSAGSLTVFSHPGLDVVDICSIGTKRFPHAAVALGLDRTLLLIQDVLHPQQGSILQFVGLQGTAYRVMSAMGHIILLTSESLYLVPDLASRFLSEESVQGSQVACCLDIHAVDASVAYDRWLLVVMPDGGVTFLEIEHLARRREKTQPSATITARLPEWAEQPQFELSYADASVVS